MLNFTRQEQLVIFVLVAIIFVGFIAFYLRAITGREAQPIELLDDDAFPQSSIRATEAGLQFKDVGTKIDINTATALELTALPSIGDVLARRIVDYRAEHGKFDTIADIREVGGIGEAKFNRIKALIEVTGTEDTDTAEEDS